MATLDELTKWRDTLIRNRALGVSTVTYDGETVTYKSDRDMAAAIADLERRISETKPGGGRRRIYLSTSKGV